MAEKLSLGGREYVHAGVGPLRQDLFLMHHARHAGLTDAAPREGESPEDFAARLLDQVLSSGRALLLLGGLLLPAGTKPEEWTEEVAYATAGHLGGLTDPKQKADVQAELVSVLLGFFESGLASWIASGSFSRAGSESGTTSPSGSTGTGTASSGNSPGTTPSVAAASPGGC